MNKIDLCNKENGNIDYEIIHFPDEQAHIKLLSEMSHKQSVEVNVRITSAEWLFLLMQVLDICNRHGMKPIVKIWYLMGARMDRVMNFNEPFTLRIVMDMLNMYDADFFVIEPHNYKIIECANWGKLSANSIPDTDIVCYPDEGAKNRYICDIRKPFIFCNKKRNLNTGKLSGFELNLRGHDINGKNVLVIDDLCDGGGTFCGIAPLIRNHKPKSISLCVTHAIQRDGILKVAALYNKVYITNSYKDWQNESLPENVAVKVW
ncbi:MAG: hypothetical protein BHV79_17690 [Bacteroides uniformis]|jgi:ribose-phosphate pyrophosphokinase|uniref:Phosphoribosyltransferase domain-containing protein n=1 Tax=Bacteroides uniformis TaxID=820 RepID=A0A1Q6HQA4_BACUN|nr:MAG: hypothetical protein BHV79_17690 [Bacteroides uniformis]